MNDIFYVVFSKRGVKRIFKRKLGQLQPGEFATKITMNVHESFFRDIIPAATLVLDEENIMQPRINYEVGDNGNNTQ